MSREFNLTPKRVPRVETRFRRIVTDLPVPQSVPVLETLYRYEPVAMRGQPPVVWDHAEGFQVYDRWGDQMGRLVLRRANHQCRAWASGDHSRHHGAGECEAAHQLLLSERNPGAPGGK